MGAGRAGIMESGTETYEEDTEYETYQDFKHKRSEGIHEEGRMRRVPDILPVSLQDILHSRKPELREGKISDSVSVKMIGSVSSDRKSLLILRVLCQKITGEQKWYINI